MLFSSTLHAGHLFPAKTQLWTIKDLPETIGDDEIYMDKSIAKKLGYSVGDEIPMIMGANGEKALNKTMKLAGYCDPIKFAAGAAVYVVSLNNYNAIFEDHPTSAYIRCEDPKGVVDTIKERSGCMINSVLTMDDYMEEVKAQNAGMSTLLYMLIGMGVILTFVAVVSNQTIGFSGRRRECAVLVSTAMSRGKLKKAFFTESLISSIVALVVAIPFAAVVAGLFQKALEMIEMNFGLSIDLLPTMAFIFGLFLLFAAPVLTGIFNLGNGAGMAVSALLTAIFLLWGRFTAFLGKAWSGALGRTVLIIISMITAAVTICMQMRIWLSMQYSPRM